MADHPSYLQHHFDTPEQQYSSGKLGMWLFLSTEVLLFAGLFCAYGVYRAIHPEIFIYAHHFLDTKLGAINTVILLCSSFTMAWAVRASQLNQRKLMAVLLSLTILGGFGFMGIKYVEYSHKIHDGLMWGKKYQPVAGGHGDEVVAADEHGAADEHAAAEAELAEALDADAAAQAAVEADPNAAYGLPESLKVEASNVPTAPAGPAGTIDEVTTRPDELPSATAENVQNVHIFFGIYFLMTGLHGIHVLLGMAAIAWVLMRGLRGDFSAAYNTPVDLVGLYWHLVDLIWIFLFPLLYLIH